MLWLWSSIYSPTPYLLPNIHSLAIHRGQILSSTAVRYNISTIFLPPPLTHWGRVTHICISKLTIIGSDNGLSPDQRQAIIKTNVGILLIGPLGTNFSEILIEIYTSSFKKLHLKMLSAKWHPSCLGLNVLTLLDGVIVRPGYCLQAAFSG